jgi:Cu+-exporting ATPase
MTEIIQLDIQGMTCASCVSHVEKGINKTSGVDMAAVNLATEKATVSYDPAITNIDEIIASVSDAGYRAELSGNAEEGKTDGKKRLAEKKLKLHTIISAVLSAPLLLAMVAGIFKIESMMFLHDPVIQLILSTPVQFWIGSRFYIGAWKSIKSFNPGMDVLVALGTSAAYFFSIFNGFIAVHVGVESRGLYFEASAVIITLVLLGKFLESNARGKTSEAIKKLMGLQPKSAAVKRQGEWIDIPVEDLVPGDIVRIKPGERIPVDGTITTGTTAVDESNITGESIPVEKTSGDRITSGTINSYGSIEFEAEYVGSDSVLSRIIAIVEEAQGSKAPIQKLADRVASIFVPIVLLIAAATFIIWMLLTGNLTDALVSSVAVLVIACPCALGLATPTAIMVGTGVGASRGILIRNGEILQKAGKIDTVVLDKTGTITNGRPVLKEVIPVGDSGAESQDYIKLLGIAAALEIHSEHPLSSAVTEAALEKSIVIEESESFSAVAGKGITGSIGGKKYYIGTRKYLQAEGIDCGDVIELKTGFEEKGNTVVILADENKPMALFAIADSIKEHSAEAVKLLKSLDIDIYMITGDNVRTARAIADEAGIDNVMAEVLPGEKAAKIEELQKLGKIVAMVGDGVNDAPALATADTGFAMGRGSDIAMESSDITLMRGDLREVYAAIILSRKTMTKIKQNLFWAFLYNSIGIPFAALGFLNPIIAGAAMAFSSVSVVSNSLSLKKTRIMKDKSMSTIIKVEGMTCDHCKRAVENAVKSVAGVDSADVILKKKTLSVTFKKNEENIDAVKAAVKEAGYKAL